MALYSSKPKLTKMKPILLLIILNLILISCETAKKSEYQKSEQVEEDDETPFWDEQQKGANYFNATPTEEWFDAALNTNIKFIRLTYEKWEGEQRDFLLGNADDYQGIVESDFQKLIYYLDYAHKLNINIVITPITLPGARWVQMNGNKRDNRLWTDVKYQKQAEQFWKDLATRLKHHPAIVGYNILNEPYPEVVYKKYSFWDGELVNWYEDVKGGVGDLNMFYNGVVNAIRSIDKVTPIIVESGLFSTPWAFEYLTPIEDENIIYSFHMYEPYVFTTKRINKGRYRYPDKMYIDDLGAEFQLDKEGLAEFLKPIQNWSDKYQIPSNQIWVGEFGCNRHIEGVENYLQDLISIFNEHNWHWSFYAYREDVWEAMDYELGKEKVFHKYWEFQDSNSLHFHYDDIYGRVKDNSLWNVFKKEFK